MRLPQSTVAVESFPDLYLYFFPRTHLVQRNKTIAQEIIWYYSGVSEREDERTFLMDSVPCIGNRWSHERALTMIKLVTYLYLSAHSLLSSLNFSHLVLCIFHQLASLSFSLALCNGLYIFDCFIIRIERWEGREGGLWSQPFLSI